MKCGLFDEALVMIDECIVMLKNAQTAAEYEDTIDIMWGKVGLQKSNLTFILFKYPECVAASELGIEATEKVPLNGDPSLTRMLQNLHRNLTNNLLRARSKLPGAKMTAH